MQNDNFVQQTKNVQQTTSVFLQAKHIVAPSVSPPNQLPRSYNSRIIDHYRAVRQQTETLCKPLQIDDFNLQGMANTSPPKWHLAHTTWFFETFVLQQFLPHYIPYHPQFAALFNSYYNGLEAAPYPRSQRGLLSRPTTGEIFNYRHAIDSQMLALLRREDIFGRENGFVGDNERQSAALAERVALGLQHEQQHQELLLTDIKYAFSLNPLLPAYCLCPALTDHSAKNHTPAKYQWLEFSEGLCEIGATDKNFCFDNETPRHRQFVHAYALADRLVTTGEYLRFIEDGGYERAELWLSDGWRHCVEQQWSAPLYWHYKNTDWRYENEDWRVFTLHGDRPLDRDVPVCHISYYEADAYARWAGARLPTECEWENAAAPQRTDGHFIEDGVLHPRAGCVASGKLQQLFGDVWEWTASPYMPYPGYCAPAGTIGEYNGKFMCNQMVLRGGSCVSPREHVRASYRNFFYPADRWQFSGIRLARNSESATKKSTH